MINDSGLSYVSKLDPQYQFEISTFLKSDNYFSNPNYGFQYGVWSKYLPIKQILPLGLVLQSQSNCSLIHLAKDSESQEINLIYFQCFDYVGKTILHQISFFNNDGVNYNLKLEIDANTADYEGNWFYYHLSCNPANNKILMYMGNIDSSYFQYQEFDGNYPFQSQVVKLQFGGSIMVDDPRFPAVSLLSSFQGVMMLEYLSQEITYNVKSMSNIYYYLFSFNAECNRDFQIIQEPANIFNSKTFITLNKQICDQFQYSGWFKVLNPDNLEFERLEMITIKPVNSFLDQSVIRALSLSISYKIDSQSNSILVQSYVYDFPSVKLDFTNNIPFQQIRQINPTQSVQKWHFITTVKKALIQTVKILFYDGTEYFLQIDGPQFTEYLIGLEIGKSFENMNGNVKLSTYSLIFANFGDFLISAQDCHISCETCTGPTQFDCSTCSITNNREYNEQLNICQCKIGFMDNFEACIDSSSAQMTLSIEEVEDSTFCEVGEFEIDGECYQCPSNPKNQWVICMECITDPKNWVLTMRCHQTYSYNLQQPAIQSQLPSIIQFYFDHKELRYFPLCLNTYFDGYMIVCIECASNIATLINGHCVLNGIVVDYSFKTICTQFCSECNGNQCTTCINVSDYYISVTDPQQCYKCLIPNCKYCFEYSGLNPNLNSLNVQIISNFDDYLLGCALCYDGFHFNFISLQCEQVVNQSPCYYSFIDQNDIQICLSTTSNFQSSELAVQYAGCNQYIEKCQSCIIDSDQIVICIICESGYYVASQTGVCIACIDEKAQTCFENTKQNKDYWIQEIQSFIFYLSLDHHLYIRNSWSLTSYSILCKENYEAIDGVCKLQCPKDCSRCEAISDKFVCVDCGFDNYGVIQRSTIGNSCNLCSNYCEFCIAQDPIIQEQQNLYYNQYNSQTQKCLKSKDDSELIKLDNKYGITKYCQSNIKCQITAMLLLEFSSSEIGLQFYRDPYYENNFPYARRFNSPFLNFRNVDTFVVKFYFTFEISSKNIWQNYLIFENLLKFYVYSLKLVKLEIFSTSNTKFISKNFQIFYYNNILIKGMIFTTQANLIEIQSTPLENDYQDFYIENVLIFVENLAQVKFRLKLSQLRTFQINQLQIKNLIMNDLRILDYIPFSYAELIKFSINNFNLLNCQIKNSTLLYLTQSVLQITNLDFFNISLQNGIFEEFSILDYQIQHTGQITIHTLIITNCTISNSKLFNFIYDSQVVIENVLIQDSYFNNAIFFTINANIKVLNFKIENVKVLDSKFFYFQNQLDQNQVIMNLENFQLINCEYMNMYIISAQIKNVYHVQIILKDFYHQNLIQLQSKQSNSFYELIRIPDTSVLESLYYYNLTIKNFTILQPENNVRNQIQLNLDCSNPLGDSAFMKIQSFTITTIDQLSVKNYFLLDKNFIFAYYVGNQNLISFEMQNIEFDSTIMLSQSSEIQKSLIFLTADNQIFLNFRNVTISQYIIQYYVQTQSIIGNAILINTNFGEVYIDGLQLNSNLVANSTSTMIYMNCKYMEIKNLKVINQNIFQYNTFKRFYNTEGLDQSVNFDQNIVTDILRQKLISNSKGGIGYLQAETIKLQNCNIQNISSYSSNIFQIQGKNNFSIELQDIFIQNAQSSLDSNTLIYGCFYIDASLSNLQISISNIVVNQAINKLQSAFLTINPSQIKNIIKIQDCEFKNVMSLKNSIFDFNMVNSYSENNIIEISNLVIQNTNEIMKYFLEYQIKSVEQTDLSSIGNQNGIIFVQGSWISLQNIFFTGHFNMPTLSIIQSSKIKLKNINFSNIQTIKHLIKISSDTITYTNIQIVNIYISNVQTFQQIFNQQIKSCPLEQSYPIDNCKLYTDNFNQIYQINTQQECNSQTLAKLNQEIDGLVIIQPYLISQFQIDQIKFLNNTCIQCSKGLLTIEVSDDTTIHLTKIQCLKNKNNIYGCIYSSTLDKYQNTNLYLKGSLFQQNICQYGCGLFSQSINVRVESTKFKQNQASRQGGGLYLNSSWNFFQNNQVEYLNNVASQGGAIFISNQILNLTQMIQTTLYNNTELQIQEKPSQLKLFYNQIEIPSYIVSNYNEMISLPNYQVVSASYNKSMLYFYVPSNQIMKEYRQFNQITRKWEETQTSILFKAVNQFDEIIYLLENTKCNIFTRDFNFSSNTFISSSENITSLVYDVESESYNFEKLLLTIDPYREIDIVRQLEISCEQIYSSKYIYQINLRSYYCQIGEYFVDEGCQKCNSQKGEFQVKANQLKCASIDTNKIKNNTESEIELNPGYWRPSYSIDLIEFCLKQSLHCLGGWIPGHLSCTAGHIGALCEECDIENKLGGGKYFKIAVSQECSQCAISWRPIISMILLSLWAILSIFLTTRSMQLTNQQFHQLKLRTKHYILLHKYNQDMAGCLIKIALNQLLVISSIFAYQIGFEINLSFLLDISQSTLSNSYNFDCTLSNYSQSVLVIYSRMVTLLLIPFGYLNVFLWLYLLYVIVKKQKYSSSNIYTSMIYMFVISQPDIIKYAGSLLANRTISGIQWIQANVDYKYNTSNHKVWMISGIMPLLLLWCVFIPFYLFWQLYKKRNHLTYGNIRKKWCYLYNEYNEDSFYWETIKIVQRQLQILVLTLFDQDIILKSTMLFFIQFVYLMIIQRIQPFNSSQLNKLEIRSVQLCILIIIVATTIFNAQQNQQQFLFYFFQVVIIILIAGNLIPIFFQIILCYLDKNIDIVITILKKMEVSNPSLVSCFKRLIDNRELAKQKSLLNKERYARLKKYLIEQSRTILGIKNVTKVTQNEEQKPKTEIPLLSNCEQKPSAQDELNIPLQSNQSFQMSNRELLHKQQSK